MDSSRVIHGNMAVSETRSTVGILPMVSQMARVTPIPQTKNMSFPVILSMVDSLWVRYIIKAVYGQTGLSITTTNLRVLEKNITKISGNHTKAILSTVRGKVRAFTMTVSTGMKVYLTLYLLKVTSILITDVATVVNFKILNIQLTKVIKAPIILPMVTNTKVNSISSNCMVKGRTLGGTVQDTRELSIPVS
ncbi:hypothetical protein D3C80_808850 [compost metagenome]